MGYEVIHGCYYGYYLFYKEGKDLDQCPICGESRWEEEDYRRWQTDCPEDGSILPVGTEVAAFV